MLILDVDGVMTDGRIFMDSNGDWKRFFNIRDGAGIRRLIEHGYKLAVITGSKSLDIQTRVKNLGIHYFFEGATDKLPSFEKLQKDSGLSPEQMAYIGDDYFDIPVLKRVAFAATVPEALDDVKGVAHYVTEKPAGNGAVREVCDFLLQYGSLNRGG